MATGPSSSFSIMSFSIQKVAASINRNIVSLKPLVPPQILLSELPLEETASETIRDGREAARRILHFEDDRLAVVIGPDVLHNVEAATEYAQKLAAYAASASGDLLIIMRTYFEHPSGAAVGWKGHINDPDMNNTFSVNKGLRSARTLLLRLASLGLPAATTFTDTLAPAYLADLITGAKFGASVAESQVHRELASSLGLPTGFAGGTRVGVEAVKAVQNGHVFLSVGAKGESRIVESDGNPDVHVVISTGDGLNLEERVREHARAVQVGAGQAARIMIDCTDGDGATHHLTQIKLAHEISRQLAESDVNESIMGVVLSSNLSQGKQDFLPGRGAAAFAPGQSVGGACMSWPQTVSVLEALREGVRARREMTRRSWD